MRKLKIIIFALLAGVVHYGIAIGLIFYGSVINPTIVHTIFSTAGFFLLLPFSVLIFIPIFKQLELDVVLGLMSLVFWVVVYYSRFKENSKENRRK